MLITEKKKHEVFGKNFATYKSSDWCAQYEAVTQDECAFMKLSKKSL